MRYEDASQTGLGQVDARNDADQLAARDYGTASGNVITGTGTITGSAGLDMVDAGQGRITAIDGAGGSDSSFSGGKLSVQGQYGTLTIDARGNYTYDRQAGTPEGVTDTFHYTLANKAGATDSARLVISFGEQPKLADASRVVPGPNGVVTLPPGVELSDIRVVGRDLVVTLPDGSLMVIVDGAIFVPQLVLGGVEVPATNLAALLIGSEPRPAAGDLVGPTNPSSGGNFEVPVAPLDPGVPLGDLLPPTELEYTPPEFEELGDILEDNDPPFVGLSSVNVSEEGVSSVAAPNPDTSGSPDTTNSASVGGILPVSDPDGDSLSVILGIPSDGLTSAGVPIIWSVSPDGHTLTGTAGGNTVVTVVINDVGAYTVNLLRPVDHPNGGGEQGASFVVPVSVSDGDEVTTGGAITVTIEDDSPTLSGRIGEPILTVDDTTLAINASGSFSGVFDASFGADGPAAANSISYALGVTAGASGIIDVSTGEQVNLVMNGGVVEGRTATTNLLVFTVTVDGSGNVVLDQLRAVQHNDSADPIETGASAATLSSDSLVTLSIVATDRDGDTATISINIGQNLRFEDDGPSIGVNGSVAEPQIIVDETVLATNASASFAGLFTGVYGADGAGTTTYALAVTAGSSGLVDVATGENVILSLVGGVVQGRTAISNDLVFTVTIDAAGVVTLDQIRAIQHSPDAGPDQPATLSADSLVRVVATITDRDGDQASASVNIGTNLVFEDDGPSIGVNGSVAEPQIIVDETVLATNASASFAGLFTGVYGADGAGTTTYALAVTAGSSGLVDVATGENVILSLVGGVVQGRTAISNDLVFTVTIDAAGVVTLDQIRAIQHSPDAGPDQPATLSADSLVRVVATITDRDGDQASASVNIGTNLVFEDDGPSIGVNGSVAEPQIIVDETVLATNASASFAGLFTGVYGADGAGTTTYALAVTAGSSGLVDVATGENVILSLVGGVVQGRTAISNDLVFTVTIDAAGVVTLDQIRAIQHSPDAGPDQPATLSADSLVRVVATITDRDGDQASASVNIGTNLVFEDDGPSIGVNGSVAEPQIIVDETVLATNASASFAGLFTGVYGADGAGTTTYALAVTAGSSGLVDVATGENVILSLVGGVVQGRTAISNDLVFTVTIDAAGVVTLDQIRAIQHSPDAGPDQPATLSADSLVRVVATITDRDGDQASASVNIGTNLVFEDDGPSSESSGVQPNLVVDETVLATNDTESFAGVFLAGFGADGPGPIPLTYALGVIAGASGLIDVATGQTVILSLNGTVVEGRTSGSNALVFTVSVAANGDVTLDQLRAVVHNDPADHDEPGASAATLSADNLITLTATATDKDGDTATVTIDIGQNLQFEDDGPSVVASGVEPNLVVDETDLVTNASASFAGLFIPNFGADGAAAVNPTTYALSVTAGPSGLVDTLSGQAVNLVMNGTTVEGRTSGSNLLVFTVTVDAAGVVTLNQIRAVVHNDPADPDEPGASAAVLTADNLIRLTATVTDGDGDTATAVVNIGSNLQFEDDGPSVVASGVEPNLVVDETDLVTNASASFAGLFIPNFGADGAAAVNPTTYALSVTAGPSGLVDTLSGQAVNLVMNGTTVEGRTSGSNLLVFTVTVDAAGVVTLNQIRAVVHNDPADPDEPGASAAVLTADNLIRLTATVTDGDGDTATAVVNIGSNLQFEDDGPSVVASGVEPNLVVDETDLVTNASASFAGLFIPNFGADGAAAVNPTTYALSVTAGPSGLVDTLSGQAVNLVMNGTTVEGRTSGSNLLVFTVTVDAAGVVTLNQIRAVVHNDPADPDEPGASAAVLTADNLIRLTATVTDGDGDTATAVVNIGSNLQFEDDGPSVVASGVEPNLVVDETDLVTNASASFAGLFIPNFGADGAAAVNPTTYALSVTAGPSGLVDTLSGQAVNLVMNGTTVEGRTSGSNLLVFTVTVDAAGVVTLNQIRAVVHNDPADPDEPGASAAVLTADNLIRLTATVTDGDGDTATAVVNIGSNLQFEDDGPSVVASGVEPNLVVDETDLVTNASASFAGLFIPNFGADGAAAVNPTTYALSVTAGPSGLVDTLSGQAVNLVMNGTTVEGRTSGSNLLVFTVTVDAAGVVTLNQIRAVVHNDPADPDEPGASAAVLTADNLIRLTATVTDGDGDTATAVVNIGSNLQFEDDGPSSGIATTGQTVMLDESAGNQVDSNDTTGPIAAFAAVANVGDDPDVAGTGPIQFATNASALVASTGSAYGADGAGTTVFGLSVAPGGVDSGLDTTAGVNIFLFLESGVVVGRVGATAGVAAGGPAAFALAIDPSTGAVSMVEYLSINHPNAANPDDSVSITNTAVQATVTVTDRDGDAASSSVNIGSQIRFQDSGPVMTAAQNMNIQNSGDVAHTAAFAFNLGADGANVSNDVITNVTGSATVGGNPVTNWSLVAGAEDATTASYSFSFDYSTGTGTATATGTLVFNKAAGTYTIDLANPIQGVTTILQTAEGTLFQGYEFGTSTPDGSQPAISVTQIQDLAGTANDIFVQFTAVSEPSSGTGDNNLEVTNWVPGADNPPPVAAGGDTAWNAGQLFNQVDGWVSTSNSANGVDGDTIQGGEVLDFSLVQGANPTGNLAQPATFAQASAMFLKFDGIGTGEDMIVILKLYDPNTNTYTTRAIMVENGDIQKGPGSGPGQYSGITLDNNDGLVIIESNDYNNPGENWVIVGAQIAGSDEGVTGTAINLNAAIGAGGDSDVDNNGSLDTDALGFQSDTNDGPFKISSIGFLTTSTTPQNAVLDFNVTVTDGDGDSITQAISATVTPAVDSTSAATIPAANTTIAPVVLDLNGDGVQFLAADGGVHYDYGSGLVATAWAGADDGILVRDANGDGTVTDASEFMFGGNGLTDMEALHAQYGDQLDASDADFVMFAIWNDANSNGIADDGELSSLAEAGIASIGLVSDGVAYTAANGDVSVAGTSSFTRTDGSTGDAADAAFRTGSRIAVEADRVAANSNNVVLAAAIAAAGLAASAPAAASIDTASVAMVKDLNPALVSEVIDLSVLGLSTDTSVTALMGGMGGNFDTIDISDQSARAADFTNGSIGELAGSSFDGMGHTALLEGSDMVAAQIAMPMMASNIAIPSAEALSTMAGIDHAQLSTSIESIIANALQGGGGSNIDTLLSALPGQGIAADAGLDALASLGNGTVPAWDMGQGAGFTFAGANLMTSEALVLHHDAIQPIANG